MINTFNMSRSYKKHNVMGYGSDSDKTWKQEYNRRFRRRASMARDEDEFDKIEDIHCVANEWLSCKDGKGMWNPEDVEAGRRSKFFNKQGKLRK